MADFIVAFITTGSTDEARTIAAALVEERLAACVNIIPQVESVYWWQGAVEADQEAKMVVKTRRALASQLIERVRELHSYDVCEVTCVPVVEGNPDYLDWIAESTSS